MLLKGTDRFHQGSLEVRRDRHHLSGRFHLGREGVLCSDELVKRETRYLDDAVIQHRLKRSIGLPCNRIWDFIQRVTESDLGADLRDRVARRF